MKMKKMVKVLCASVLVAFGSVALISCGGGNDDPVKPKHYTHNTYTAVSPANWNELTYQDNNDTQIMSYLASNFFEFDFKYDEKGNILDGQFEVEYSAATKLEDVTSQYVGDTWGIEEGATERAFKITLRQDLKWDDGKAIKAEDFVYTMQQLLAPEFQNYRADTFYVGSKILHNAENYAKQGQVTMVDNAPDGDVPTYVIADLVKGADGVYALPNGRPVRFALNDKLGYLGQKTVTQYSPYLDQAAFKALVELADEKGRVEITDETIALWATLIDTVNWGNEGPEYIPFYMVYEREYAQMSFDQVGIFVGDTEYEIVLILDKALDILDDQGNLSYNAAYSLNNLPLVHREKYEANKVAPTEGNKLWTSTYNSNVSTSASWGPYKLTRFQSGKEYVLEKNENWFGYNIEQYQGQYQTEKIVCETIAEWNTAWLKFRAGEIDGIGIDVTIAPDYKGSERAYFTPDDFIASLQLQSNKEALKARESEGVNKTLLTYTDFRKALSLSIDRADFAYQTTTSSMAGYGIFNSMHYYDVANGGVYRNTDEAKKVLCDVYAIDVNQYDSLDDAVNAITGYNLTEARALVTKAYNEALAAGDIKSTDKVELTFGSSITNEVVTRRHNYIKNAWKKLVETTPLEGRLVFSQDVEKGDAWADDFRAGAYDICMGGWTGGAWDPGYFLGAYLLEGNRYALGWDPETAMLKFTLEGFGENGEDIEEEMSLLDWYYCLNGAAGAKYNLSTVALDNSKRLPLIAAIEGEILKTYYTVPLYNNFGASLMSYKVDYKTYVYNTFMGYGGIRYMTYNYTDAEWAELVAENNGELDYR